MSKEMELFIEKLKAELVETLPHEYADAEITVVNVQKGRKIVPEICIRKPGANGAAPSIAVDEFFYHYMEDDLSIQEIAKEMAGVITDGSYYDAHIMGQFTDYESCKDKVLLRLYNTEVGAIPYPHAKTTDDLAAVCYLQVALNGMKCVANVTESMLSKWNVSFEDVLMQARKNMCGICDFENLVLLLSFHAVSAALENGLTLNEAEEYAVSQFPMDNGIYVLTSEDGYLGAGMLAVPEVLEKCMPEGKFYIFPSSIHELVVAPFIEGQPREEMNGMVKSINENEVAPTEQLSDSVYVYEMGKLYTL